MATFRKLRPPEDGHRVQVRDGTLVVPDDPVVPFIEGDGTGPDIWRATARVLEAAVAKAYGGQKRVVWFEVCAGDKAQTTYGEWLPPDTLEAIQEYRVAIKGPLTTPIGGGFRSLNVALRQLLDLYVCLRPVRYFAGTPSPVRHPEKVDMVIFRENTEDIYAGIEWHADTPEAKRVVAWLRQEMGVTKIRFPETSSVGVKPVSREGSIRLVRAAIRYALRHRRRSVTLVHKGNIMKFTEGAFKDWGYEVASREFPQHTVREEEVASRFGGKVPEGRIVIKDRITDSMFQQVLLRPDEYDVLATLNLNGDYLSDAVAAQVGGIGIAPGGNINYETGHAVFEATHGTAPKYAGQDKVNPSSLILSGAMMFDYLGWTEAAARIHNAMSATLRQKRVTYDFARLIEDAHELKCSGFADALIENLGS